jgi:ribonuclease T1
MIRNINIKLVLTSLMLGVLAVSYGVQAKEGVTASGVSTVSLAELPRQGVETYRLIHQGGPFPYEKDGVVFGNRERILAAQKRGYYHEYTVATPGERNRGTRRIVCGGVPKAPDACFYTADHYASFRKIVP